MDNEKQTQVTSISELQSYINGVVIELPRFAEGQPFFARIKRPSLLALVKEGKIPNTLLSKANALFAGTASFAIEDENALKEVFEVLEIFTGACFVEPTYDEIKNGGIELTDEQLMFIFNYAQKGTKQLEGFRGPKGNPRNNQYGKNVQNNAKPYIKN